MSYVYILMIKIKLFMKNTPLWFLEVLNFLFKMSASSLNSISLIANSIDSQTTTINSVICPSLGSSSRQISPTTTISTSSLQQQQPMLKYTLQKFQNPLYEIVNSKNNKQNLNNQIDFKRTIKNGNYLENNINRNSNHETHKILYNNNKNHYKKEFSTIQYNTLKSKNESKIQKVPFYLLKDQKLDEKIYANLTEISNLPLKMSKKFQRSFSRSPLRGELSENKTTSLKMNNRTTSSNSIQMTKKSTQGFSKHLNLEKDMQNDKTSFKPQTKEKKNNKNSTKNKK